MSTSITDQRGDGDRQDSDLVGTVGLLLNIGGVIAAAVWFSMLGGADGGGSATVAGFVTLTSLAASFACFARR